MWEWVILFVALFILFLLWWYVTPPKLCPVVMEPPVQTQGQIQPDPTPDPVPDPAPEPESKPDLSPAEQLRLSELLACKPTKPNRNKAEAICRKYLEQRFNQDFPSCRPDFLRNPETGYNLELDCYNSKLKLAVEYNGVQHYEFPNYTKQLYQDFANGVRRDRFKLKMCELMGIYLIRVPYKVKYEDIPTFIESKLPPHLKYLSSN